MAILLNINNSPFHFQPKQYNETIQNFSFELRAKPKLWQKCNYLLQEIHRNRKLIQNCLKGKPFSCPKCNALFIRRGRKRFHSSSGDICFKMKVQNEHISWGKNVMNEWFLWKKNHSGENKTIKLEFLLQFMRWNYLKC